MNLKQIDLFNQTLSLCPFCGYPMFPFSAFRCEYKYFKGHEDFNPFLADWHINLEEEEKLQELWAPKIIETAKKALEERPRLLLEIEASRNESWVKSHAVKLRKEVSQVSLIGYIIRGGASASKDPDLSTVGEGPHSRDDGQYHLGQDDKDPSRDGVGVDLHGGVEEGY